MALLVGRPQGADLSILDVAPLLEGVVLIRTSTVSSLDAGGVHWETGDTAQFLETVFAGADTLDAGNSQGSFLFGLDGDDLILGSPGGDLLLGGEGNDTLLSGQGDDVILAGAGEDAIHGFRGDDIIVGGSGHDYIHGGQGSDIIAAGSGDDILYGDRGDDWLIGGPGADEFYFLAGGGSDIVTDFNPAEGDLLELEPGATFTVSVVGLNTVVDLGGGDQFTLLGVQTTSLPSSWLG